MRNLTLVLCRGMAVAQHVAMRHARCEFADAVTAVN